MSDHNIAGNAAIANIPAIATPTTAIPPNHFARFGLTPQPWLDQDSLKQRFLDLSAQIHPDKAAPAAKSRAEQEFQSLNESYNILRHTRSRILHFLELSGVAKQEHVQNVPPAALAFFAEVAAANKNADLLIREKAAALSPMLKVQFMDKSMDQLDAIQHLQEKIRAAIRQIENRLQSLPPTNPPPDPTLLRTLAEDAAALGFLDRWLAQLQDRVAALTF